MNTNLPRFSQSFSEVVLVVADVSRSAAFYCDVVRLVPCTEADASWAWFWAGVPGQSQRLALHKGPLLFEEHSPNPPGNRFGSVHYAFHVDRSDLEAATAHVRACGVPVYGPTHFEWMRAESFYFYDPDGNLLEWWSPDPQNEKDRTEAE